MNLDDIISLWRSTNTNIIIVYYLLLLLLYNIIVMLATVDESFTVNFFKFPSCFVGIVSIHYPLPRQFYLIASTFSIILNLLPQHISPSYLICLPRVFTSNTFVELV